MAWSKILQRRSFSYARRIAWLNTLMARPFFARGSKAQLRTAADSMSSSKAGFITAIEETAGSVFSILLSTVLIIALASIVIAFVIEMRRDTFTFEGISVPKSLLDRGYSAAAVSEEAIAEIRRIQESASLRHQRRNLESLMSLPDLQLSSSGLSMNSLVRYTTRLLGLSENRISGKILQDGDQLRLVIVVWQGSRSEATELHRSEPELAALLRDAGRAIVQSVDGYVLSYYLMEQEKPVGKFPATLAAIGHVLTHPPAADHPWALELLGRVRHLEGSDDIALEQFRTLVSLYPHFAHGPGDYVEQLVKMRRIAEAKQFSEDRRKRAKSAEDWAQVFWTTHNLGNWLGAVDAANHELALNGLTGYDDLFHALGHAGRNQEALAILEQGLKKDPKRFAPYVDGTLLALSGRKQEGIDMAKAELLAAAEKGDPLELRQAYEDLGAVLFAAGDPKAAMVEYKNAIARGITEDGLGYAYGRSLIAIGQPQQALGFFERKILDQPRVWDGHIGAARAHVALGQFEQANQIFERVALESPLDPEMFADWAKSLDAVRDVEMARKARALAARASEDLGRPMAWRSPLPAAPHSTESPAAISLLGRAHLPE